MEQVPYPRIAPQLEQLPTTGRANATNTNSTAASSILNKVSTRRLLPPVQFSKTEMGNRKAKITRPLAKAGLGQKRSVVLDYVTINSGQTHYTFQGGMTYYISGTVNISGNTFLEGGAVLKYPTNGSGCLVPDSQDLVTCQTGSYRPAIFTSMNDNSVGETISGSTGSPTTNSDTYISFQDNAGLKQCALNNIRALYAGCAIADDFEDGAVQLVVSDSQFINCTFAFDTWSPRQIFKNDLFSHCWCIVDQGNGGDVQLIHTTADLSWSFINDSTDWTSSSVELTNSILTSVTNMIDLWGYPPYSYNAPVILQNSLIAGTNNHANIIQSQNSYQIASATGIYQTVGGGSYYLTNGSPYRNAGTTNIDPTLLADIATKTTYPPIVYANQTISTNLILAPQVSRDTNTTPDLGYHYDPLDWVFAETEVDSNITFTAGTAVGWYRTTSGWYDAGDGIHLMNGATANLTGTATAPVWWVRLNTVQEHDLSGGYGPGGLTSWGSGPSSYLATIQARFLHTSAFDSDGDTFRDAGCCGGGHLLVQATDCEFYGTGVAGYYLTLDFTNCLFFRNEIGAQSDHNDAGVTLQNCTSYGGDYYDVVVQHWSGATWPVYIVDSAFENCDFHYMDTNYSYYDYNAFIQGQNRLPISGAHDVTVTNSFNWQTSWLGAFYQSTNSPLLNKGSTSATNVGLYHFTTQTNQTVEGTNIVSIGYHYVAVDQYGNPLDSNGDGIPDYLEDANGNGLVDSGEIGWNIVGDLGLKVLITQPRNGSNVP